LLHGGGHERGMRSGTMNLPGIVGFGYAVELTTREMSREAERLKRLRDLLWTKLQAEIEGVELNGHLTERLPHNLSVAIPGIESRSLLVQLKHDVALSTGSACTTAKVEPSHVLLALGFGAKHAHSSVRFGLGLENTEADINFVMERLSEAAKTLWQLTTSH
ncbi:MAG: aminotransferase class V-fold PLP-dependent enzyme, partial [Pyrinomonadaceae bacterium]